MLSQVLGDILPLAVVVSISPIPIVGVVLMLGTPNARVNGWAFLLGWVGGLLLVGSLVLLVAKRVSASGDDGPATWVGVLELLLGLVLLNLARKQWVGRPRGDEQPELPGWMATVDKFSAPKALGFGFVLAAVNPKNLLVTLAAAASIASGGLTAAEEAVALGFFVIIATLGPGIPVLLHALAPTRAERLLADLKVWLSRNNATIMAVLLVVIGAKVLGSGIAAVG